MHALGIETMTHAHTAQHTTRLDGGVTYEVCDCGATRKFTPGKPIERWHTCELCTHEYGRNAK